MKGNEEAWTAHIDPNMGSPSVTLEAPMLEVAKESTVACVESRSSELTEPISSYPLTRGGGIDCKLEKVGSVKSIRNLVPLD